MLIFARFNLLKASAQVINFESVGHHFSDSCYRQSLAENNKTRKLILWAAKPILTRTVAYHNLLFYVA